MKQIELKKKLVVVVHNDVWNLRFSACMDRQRMSVPDKQAKHSTDQWIHDGLLAALRQWSLTQRDLTRVYFVPLTKYRHECFMHQQI